LVTFTASFTFFAFFADQTLSNIKHMHLNYHAMRFKLLIDLRMLKRNSSVTQYFD